MDRHEAQILDLLKAHGAVLDRQHKHNVWKLPNGKVFVMSKTPGKAWTSWRCHLTDLKHLLGMVKTEATVGERRERKAKRQRAHQDFIEVGSVQTPDFREKLKGLLEVKPRFVPEPVKVRIALTPVQKTPLEAILGRLLWRLTEPMKPRERGAWFRSLSSDRVPILCALSQSNSWSVKVSWLGATAKSAWICCRPWLRVLGW